MDKLARKRTLLGAGLGLTLLALGLLAAAVSGPGGSPRLSGPGWARIFGYFFLLLVLAFLAVVMVSLTWFLIRWVLARLAGPRADDQGTPRVLEEPRPPASAYAVLFGLLGTVAGVFAWILSHRKPGTLPYDVFNSAGSIVSEIPGGSTEPAGPLVRLVAGAFGVATVTAAVVGLVAVVVLFIVERRVPLAGPRTVTPSRPASPPPDAGRQAPRAWGVQALDGVDCSDPYTGILHCYAVYLEAAERLGFGLPGRTPRELQEAVAARFPDLTVPAGEMTGLYERFRYGPYVPQAGDCRTVLELCRMILTHLERGKGVADDPDNGQVAGGSGGP